MAATEYSDYDTEQARAAEFSSAGKQTQQLSGLPGGATVAQPAARGNNLGALLLIGLGVLLLIGRLSPLMPDFTAGFVLLTIASCFLFFAFWKNVYGLVIPGSILAGLAVGVPLAGITNGVSVLWGLALGFLAILFVGRAWFGMRSSWPVYPAVPLFAVGIIVAISNLPALFTGGIIWLPILLIAAGLYLGWRGRTA